MWVYDIFSGVQLMVVDFAIESCFRGSGKENVIGINHCEKGRYECAFDNKSYIYLGEGDIGISNGCLRPRSDMITCFVEGCAMIKEELGEDKFRFYCNDIDWDDDFDDLIFDLEIEKVAYEE